MIAGDWRWSISKSNLLAECPRAFRYSTSSERLTAKGVPRWSLGALGGIAIHQAISKELDKWAIGEPISPVGAVQNVENFLDSVWTDRKRRLIESVNGDEPDPNTIRLLRRASVLRIQRFFHILWPQFSHFKHEEHESLHEFELDGVTVAIRIDLACWGTDKRLCIIDWKTGGWENVHAVGPQLAVYSLWAHLSRGIPVADITPILVGLESGAVVRFQTTEEDLEQARDMIREDRAKVDHYSIDGEFPAAAEPRRCRGCRYLKQCDEGRACTGLFPHQGTGIGGEGTAQG